MTKRRKASDAGEASVPPAPSSSERETLDASVASLSGLNLDQLRLRWWNHLGRIAPAHLPDGCSCACSPIGSKPRHSGISTRVGGGLWLSYLFVLFYLAVAAGAVTHADLFFEKPVKLPFLGVELPLVAFFFLAPILFLVVHAYALVHLKMLAEKAQRFYEELRHQIGTEATLSDTELQRRQKI